MNADEGVRLIDGVIEAGLGALAARSRVGVDEAPGIGLRHALAEQGRTMPGQPTMMG